MGAVTRTSSALMNADGAMRYSKYGANAQPLRPSKIDAATIRTDLWRINRWRCSALYMGKSAVLKLSPVRYFDAPILLDIEFKKSKRPHDYSERAALVNQK
jgi:hypothetical protein